MIDCIASYHLNPHGCGVAKFNYRLAQELRVPVVPLGEPRANALVSVKWEELPLVCQGKESEWFTLVQPYDLFLHGDRPSDDVMNHARRIFHGSTGAAVRHLRDTGAFVWRAGRCGRVRDVAGLHRDGGLFR